MKPADPSFLASGSWLEKQFRAGLEKGRRWHTMKAALNIAHQLGHADTLIVETGCQREPDDWGAGCSTSVWDAYVKRYGGSLISVDNSPEHVERCERTTGVRPICSDSVAWLTTAANADEGPFVSLLYLDSFDYPLGNLLEVYGGKSDIDNARRILDELGEAEIVHRHGNIIAESQDHCLREIMAAEPMLSYGSAVLIDDVLPGGGKPRRAKEWMREQGWECVLEDYQTLWVVR